ncbi:hypothetical protein [Microbacterium aerolatum]|uniref:hypothetical protein n=1 Tax=Microbacterium aerolatum TaxID=153731 RepID=UPI00384C4EF9
MTCDPDTIRCQIERIADAVTGWDTNSFASTLLATLIGAAAAAGMSWWLTARDRPKPVWRVETGRLPREPRGGAATVKVTATNIGDGTAYGARLILQGTTRDASDSVAVVEPGSEITAWIHFPMTGKLDWDPQSDASTDTRESTWDDATTARVEWLQPPRRHHVRKHRAIVPKPLP